MDYYRQPQAVNHAGPTQQNYMYQPTTTPSNSGMYYQTPINAYAHSSPYPMQPSVSQGTSMMNSAPVSVPAGNGRRVRGSEAGGIIAAGVPRNQNEVPLRMIVDAKYVGAIIGHQGNKVKEITRDTKAKCIVDAQKGMRDPQESTEKVILIDGLPDNSTKAVVKILEVIEAEKEKERDRDLAGGDSGLDLGEKTGEVELKLRAHNQLVGRLIGKQGATIKKIMSETDTVIFVSNSLPEGAAATIPLIYHDILMLSDRTITVKGPSIAAVSAAEQKISAKLRQSFEFDVSNRMYGAAAAALPMMPMAYDPAAVMAAAGMRPPQTSSFKHAKMYVPNTMVGAIIGSKGTHIRGIMRSTGAMMRIEGNEKREGGGVAEKKEAASVGGVEEAISGVPTPEERDGSPPADGVIGAAAAAVKEHEAASDDADGKRSLPSEEERLVTISGNDNQIYRAQYAVFAKIAEQNQQYLEEVRLRSEINVPSRLVGRIIGKGGQNVRELQRLTGAHVKIAEENNPENHKDNEDGDASYSTGGPTGETTVRITGNMNATINVQARIAALIGDFHRTKINENRPNGSHSAGPTTGVAASSAAVAAPAAQTAAVTTVAE